MSTTQERYRKERFFLKWDYWKTLLAYGAWDGFRVDFSHRQRHPVWTEKKAADWNLSIRFLTLYIFYYEQTKNNISKIKKNFDLLLDFFYKNFEGSFLKLKKSFFYL